MAVRATRKDKRTTPRKKPQKAASRTGQPASAPKKRGAASARAPGRKGIVSTAEGPLFFDEMTRPDGTIRPAYYEFDKILRDIPVDVLKTKQGEADGFFS